MTDIAVRIIEERRWHRFKHWFFHGLAPDLDVEIDGVRIKAAGRHMVVLGDGGPGYCDRVHFRSGKCVVPGSCVTLRRSLTVDTAYANTLTLGGTLALGDPDV